MISRELIEDMFDDMQNKYGWRVEEPLLWGYFFTCSGREELEALAAVLSRGYSVVDIYLGDREADEAPEVWWLHVQKVEPHTVDSLCTRNDEFSALASEYRSVDYDGMDVGPAPT